MNDALLPGRVEEELGRVPDDQPDAREAALLELLEEGTSSFVAISLPYEMPAAAFERLDGSRRTSALCDPSWGCGDQGGGRPPKRLANGW